MSSTTSTDDAVSTVPLSSLSLNTVTEEESKKITERFEERRWRGQDRWLRALSQAEPNQALLQATPQVHEIHVLQRGLRENRLPKSPSKKESCSSSYNRSNR